MMQTEFEAESQQNIARITAGTDEVGRGPLAGDVVAAAVVLDPQRPIKGLADSKQLSERKRLDCYARILDQARAWAVARASVAEIEELNILQASLMAIHRAVTALPLQPDFVYVDGNRCPRWSYPSQAIVKGDARVPCIAAASVIAKVTRDREMQECDEFYPGYGFARHKGYPSPEHLAALKRLGPCQIHRRTFGPVAELLK